MDVSGDEIAEAVLEEFDKWPTKRKPLLRGEGVKEWVPLSGIVAQGETSKIGDQTIGLIIQVGRDSLKCLAAA
jgi:hypothetical protein